MLPLIIAAGVGAAAVGVKGHIDAKETNELANRKIREAENMYNRSKSELEVAQNEAKEALIELGYAKKNVLDSSMQQFIQAYDRIKDIQVEQSVGLREIAKFSIDQHEIIQIKKMENIYDSTISSGAAGAAAGAAMALGASGLFGLATETLSAAGTLLTMGAVESAATVAGSALSMGAAGVTLGLSMAPLSTFVAPIVLFTGVSASMKADENWSKALATYSEARVASEKMKTAETMCKAITNKSNMFNDLLNNLNSMFSECTGLLNAVTLKKIGLFKTRTIKAKDLSEEEKQLIAVTRALAGAVKAIIDTPILSEDGTLAQSSQNVYDTTTKALPEFAKGVNDVRRSMKTI